jgi:hypothetical protein
MVDENHPPPNVGKERVQEGKAGGSIKSRLVNPKTWWLAIGLLRLGVWTYRAVMKVGEFLG